MAVGPLTAPVEGEGLSGPSHITRCVSTSFQTKLQELFYGVKDTFPDPGSHTAGQVFPREWQQTAGLLGVLVALCGTPGRQLDSTPGNISEDPLPLPYPAFGDHRCSLGVAHCGCLCRSETGIFTSVAKGLLPRAEQVEPSACPITHTGTCFSL